MLVFYTFAPFLIVIRLLQMDDNQLLTDNNNSQHHSMSAGQPATSSKRAGAVADASDKGQADLGTVPPPSVPAEAKEAGSPLFKEAEPRVIEQKEFKVPAEVKDWIEEEKKEEITLPHPVKDEYGQILLESAAPQRPKIVLPLTQDQTKLALKKTIVESVRWLAVWCLRIFKMFPKRASYK